MMSAVSLEKKMKTKIVKTEKNTIKSIKSDMKSIAFVQKKIGY